MTDPKKSAARLLSILALAFGVAGCSESVGVADVTTDPDPDGEPQLSLIRILLTDAPVDYIAEAMVDIGRVSLVPADDGDHVILSEDGTDDYVNLLDFQDAATTPIAEAEIDAGEYAQLRMVVERARVTLKDPYTFRDGSTQMDLTVPSGAQSGIKLNLHDGETDGPVEIVPGETVLVLDFDVSRSFVLRGNPDTPAGVHGVNFTPSIRVTAMDVAASISGVVSTDLEGVSVEGLVVTAEPTEEGSSIEGYQTMAGTAMTDSEGAYTIHFLVPGSYEVTVAVDAGLGTDPESRPVTVGNSEDATGADFEIIDVSGSISGTVTTTVETASVDGLTVTATSAVEGAEPMMATTDAEGVYSFESVLPGTYAVTVEAGEDLVTDPAAAEVAVGNGEDVVGVDFEIIEDVSGTIAGTISTTLQGVTVEGLTVTATPAAEGAEPLTATAAGDGTYLFESVAPGDYTLAVEVGEGQTTDPATLDVTVEENGEVTGANFAVIAAGS